MFELDQTELASDLASPELPYQPVTGITDMSLLIWGEHCIECAAPACYNSCDLYESRPDTRCRRFQNGARRNPNFPSFRGYGVEIEFKQWAKVEARGNTRLAPARSIERAERMLEGVAGVVNGTGKAAAALTRYRRLRWVNQSLRERLSRTLHRRAHSSGPPGAFLLEVYSLETAPMNLTLAIVPAVQPGQRSEYVGISHGFRTTFVLPPGYSRHEVDYRLFQKVAERDSFDVSLTPGGDAGGRLVILTADFVRLAAIPRPSGEQPIKCVVWDLDNTLWDGVLLEGAHPQVRQDVLKLLHFLDDRGILLSIASKNDAEGATAALQSVGLADYFLYPQISWNPKSESIRRIVQQLNIGLDTVAFIDDNPFEREEVAAALPGLLCLDAADVIHLAADPRFQGSTSSEARSRRGLYQQAIQREEEEKRYGSDYLGFLRTCDIRLEVAEYTPDTFDRAAELVQRTNQLNFSGRKYTREQLLEILENDSIDKYVLRCSDKYGSYGTIGVALVRARQDELFVEDFMVSCRVQGKFLELAFFAHIFREHNRSDARYVRVNYQQTAKNAPARKVLETIGFSTDAGTGMVMPAGNGIVCDFISVACSCSAAGLQPSSAAPVNSGAPQ